MGQDELQGTEVDGDHPLFAALADFCRSCGVARPGPVCEACGTPTAVPVRQPLGLLGARATLKRRLRSVRGTVVRDADPAEVLLDDGTLLEVPSSALGEVMRARRSGAYYPPSELLLVAEGPNTPDVVRPLLTERALGPLGDDVVAHRGLLVDLTGLGQVAWVGHLLLSTTELAWWRAATLVAAGDLTAAAHELLELHGTTYPLRLAVWARAVVHGKVERGDGLRLQRALEPFVDALGLSELAARAVGDRLSRSLGAPRDVAGVAACVRAAAADDERWAVLVAPASNTKHPLAQLLVARETGHLDPAWPAELLDAAPPSIVDDLVDRGAVTDLEGRAGLRCAEQLRDRLDGRPRSTAEDDGDRDAATMAAWLTCDLLPNELAALARDGLWLGYGHPDMSG